MSETTKTPRAHAEMAARFMADSSLKCWAWVPSTKLWVENERPIWLDNLIYHVGHEKPTAPPKRKVTIAGITFDAPETDELAQKTEYWLVRFGEVFLQFWDDDSFDKRWLGNGLVHLDEENARLHAQALLELNRQLCGMEDAK